MAESISLRFQDIDSHIARIILAIAEFEVEREEILNRFPKAANISGIPPETAKTLDEATLKAIEDRKEIDEQIARLEKSMRLLKSSKEKFSKAIEMMPPSNLKRIAEAYFVKGERVNRIAKNLHMCTKTIANELTKIRKMVKVSGITLYRKVRTDSENKPKIEYIY